MATYADAEPSCGWRHGVVRAEANAYIMGTTFHVVAYGHRREGLELAISKALDEARRLDRMLSNYRPESELSQLNRFAAHGPIKVSAEFLQFLSACIEYSKASEGTFDITVGPLMKISGLYKGIGRIPGREELLAALRRVGYRNIVLDEENMTVRFAQDGVELDPGGTGKGYAVDKMVTILKEHQVDSALISAGSSTIYALGSPPSKPGWKVAIKDPHQPSKLVEAVMLKNESLSTSGNYENFFFADGKIWSHIMDPRTGYPAMGSLSVSVIAPRTIDSEVWAKPYYILGPAWAKANQPRNFRVFCCEDKPATPCAWL